MQVSLSVRSRNVEGKRRQCSGYFVTSDIPLFSCTPWSFCSDSKSLDEIVHGILHRGGEDTAVMCSICINALLASTDGEGSSDVGAADIIPGCLLMFAASNSRRTLLYACVWVERLLIMLGRNDPPRCDIQYPP